MERLFSVSQEVPCDLDPWERRNCFVNASGVQFGGEDWILSPKKETVTNGSAREACRGWVGLQACSGCLRGRWVERSIRPLQPWDRVLTSRGPHGGQHIMEPRFLSFRDLPSPPRPVAVSLSGRCKVSQHLNVCKDLHAFPCSEQHPINTGER